MPRDDLSIDFVKRMPHPEAADPALILDDWINRTANLPEEIRFLQEEITEKDRQYDRCIREIEDRDAVIQKWIRANGSHIDNPREPEYRATIAKDYETADQLAAEKIALARKMQIAMDKHLRLFDLQIKQLQDRGELGFANRDELPSILRVSDEDARPAALARVPQTANGRANGGALVAKRGAHVQLKNSIAAARHASVSAPATPAASVNFHRQAREDSAGPGGGVPKRGPRAIAGLGSLPATSSGLARHSSLGPGMHKTHTTSGHSRAGSAGPRAALKGWSTSRKASMSSAQGSGRKKSTSAAGGNKSGLWRVKRAAKNIPSLVAESELSGADSASDDDSDVRTVGRRTPLARSSSNAHSLQYKELSHHRDLVGGGGGGGEGAGSATGGSGHKPLVGRGHRPRSHGALVEDEDDDAMDVEDDDAGDDSKYCLCQNVSFGDMVACDNEECPYEWFHWSCVGLKSEPIGRWFCPQCREDKPSKGK